MNLSAKSPWATIGTLLFLSIWLSGWTLGVSGIQAMLVSGEAPWLLVIFLFSHGGAEVAVLWSLATSIQQAADAPAEEPTIELAHEGVTARWRNGNGSVLVAGFAAVLVGLIHCALFGSLFAAAMSGPMMGWVLTAIMSMVWLFTASLFIKPIRAHMESRGDVVLTADLDAVRVRYDNNLLDRDEEVFPLLGLETTMSEEGVFWMSDGTRELELLMAPGNETTSLVDLLQTMANRATAPDQVAFPESLNRLRTEG